MLIHDFSLEGRGRGLERAATEPVDLLVVGGGITGAGVVREAALRGLTALVVDKGDFAGGTSSRSSKLIHGGLRYLAQGDVALVREAARERAVLHRLAPHLAQPVDMMIPTSSLAGRMKMQAGLWTFEKLAGGHDGHPYSVNDLAATVRAEPRLRTDRLAGSVVFQEFITDDARLVLETLRSAVAHGGMAANYCRVTAVQTDPGGLRVDLEDGLADSSLVVRCRCLVNAAGPWFDAVRGLCEPGGAPMLQMTRGIHVVVPHAALPVAHSVVLRSPDGRSTFVVPRGDIVYVGTTDTHYEGDAHEPGVSADDVDYLLESCSATFEDAPGPTDIIGVWSGVRPLLRQADKKPSEISRRDEIIIGPGPVVGVAGGKLTTYRRMAERVIGKVLEILGSSAGADVDSAEHALIGGSAEAQTAARAVAPRLTDQELENRLWSTYGIQAAAIVVALDANPGMADPVADLPSLTQAELEYCVRNEMVATLDDLLRRRTRVAIFDGRRTALACNQAATALGALLGWTADRCHNQATTVSDLAAGELAVARKEAPPRTGRVGDPVQGVTSRSSA